MKKYITPGLILILAGLYFLVDALPGVDLPGSVFFLAVGLALLIARLTTGRYGLSIAGLDVYKRQRYGSPPMPSMRPVRLSSSVMVTRSTGRPAAYSAHIAEKIARCTEE